MEDLWISMRFRQLSLSDAAMAPKGLGSAEVPAYRLSSARTSTIHSPTKLSCNPWHFMLLYALYGDGRHMPLCIYIANEPYQRHASAQIASNTEPPTSLLNAAHYALPVELSTRRILSPCGISSCAVPRRERWRSCVVQVE